MKNFGPYPLMQLGPSPRIVCGSLRDATSELLPHLHSYISLCSADTMSDMDENFRVKGEAFCRAAEKAVHEKNLTDREVWQSWTALGAFADANTVLAYTSCLCHLVSAKPARGNRSSHVRTVDKGHKAGLATIRTMGLQVSGL